MLYNEACLLELKDTHCVLFVSTRILPKFNFIGVLLANITSKMYSSRWDREYWELKQWKNQPLTKIFVVKYQDYKDSRDSVHKKSKGALTVKKNKECLSFQVVPVLMHIPICLY